MKITKLERELHARLFALTGVGYAQAGPEPFYRILRGEVVAVVVDACCDNCKKVRWKTMKVCTKPKRTIKELFTKRRRRKKK